MLSMMFADSCPVIIHHSNQRLLHCLQRTDGNKEVGQEIWSFDAKLLAAISRKCGIHTLASPNVRFSEYFAQCLVDAAL